MVTAAITKAQSKIDNHRSDSDGGGGIGSGTPPMCRFGPPPSLGERPLASVPATPVPATPAARSSRITVVALAGNIGRDIAAAALGRDGWAVSLASRR